ncbi:MAG: STAS domain-containing protein [Phycisphaeraceae bacterium]|nr:STAS domain-containing protein [Phycisphaeraceae bacterium]
MADSMLPVRQTGPAVHLPLAECLIQNLSPEVIGRSIVQLIDEKPDIKLIISFEDVEHLSSASLGMLLMVKNSVEQRGGQLRLARLNARIRDLFDLTMLTRRFSIHVSVDDAVKSFS